MAKGRGSEGESHSWLEEAQGQPGLHKKKSGGMEMRDNRERKREREGELFLDAGAGWTGSGVTSHPLQPIHLTHFYLPLVRLSLRTCFKGFGEKA